ncbi:MAG: threonine synthase, partial [Spirochaetales bacterium]|nr:threonine synthase [Spirochaetales bacterium]
MKYFSTGKNSEPVSFKEALLQGLAPDRGLYLPESFPTADSAIFEKDSFQDMAFEMAKLLVDGEIPDADLRKLTDDAF